MEQSIFITLLTSAVQHAVSDIHIKAGETPAFRIRGDLMGVKCPPLTDADVLQILRYIVPDPKFHERLAELKEFDGSFEVKNLGRFRFNIFRHQGKLGAILRLIPGQVPTIEKLGLPPVLRKISQLNRGLVLVTGATGSGKSSTLAAIIDSINSQSPVHVLTIEDPVEFMHVNKRARITQREVGRDTGNFAEALRAALRQDPDVILVGEMRDAETIDIALKAAETGHLVFSTVHTTDAIKTIGRLVSVFPAEEQRMVRMRLADNLVATVSQRLVKRSDGKGVVAAQEIMISNPGIQECIGDASRTGEINDFISKSREISGGQTFDQHLVELYQKNVISLAAAKEASTNPSDFERNLVYGATVRAGDSRQAMRDTDSVQLERSQPAQAKPAEAGSENSTGFPVGHTRITDLEGSRMLNGKKKSA
jgi:twitching motility protein PilT